MRKEFVPMALVRMSAAERERYVRWWLEQSGLTRAEVRDVATGIWAGYAPPTNGSLRLGHVNGR